MEIDWSKAPDGAEFYACGDFRREKDGIQQYWFDDDKEWCDSRYTAPKIKSEADYVEKPKEWPTEQRIDIIATNGGDGEHYNHPPKTSAEYLSECLRVQTERGKQYDASGTGERSFEAAADAFNAATGKSLTGSDVCLLLTMVKLVRQYSSPDRLHQDSLLDGVSYMSLRAEELTKELGE